MKLNNNKILLIITFFHRTKTLDSLEKYYKDKNVDIVFVDQSYSQQIKKTKLNNILEIIHYPADKINFYEMWIKIYTKYGKKYSYFVWNNDDDFTIPKSISDIENFLNTDYGRKFALVTGQVYQIDKSCLHVSEYATFEVYKQDVIDAEPMERIRKIFNVNGVHVNPHAVIKSEVFKTCCELILKTSGQPNCLMPIRFFDKIITLIAGISGSRKTNFDNITSVRTHRSFTGSLMKRPDFPACLEKDVPYSQIIDRLNNNNIIAQKFNLDEKLLLDYIKPSNITEGTFDKSEYSPHKNKNNLLELKEVIDAIKFTG